MKSSGWNGNRADLTEPNPEIKQAMERFGSSNMPTSFLGSSVPSDEVIVLPEIFGPEGGVKVSTGAAFGKTESPKVRTSGVFFRKVCQNTNSHQGVGPR